MPKIAKYIAIAVAALIVLLIAAAGIIAATFNPNDYKPQIIKLVQEKKQRTLTIPGDIKLRFFPKIGADLGRVGISERNSSAEFASIDSAKVSLALIPLLSKNLVVDHLDINGMRANIRRNQDGTTNYDDLLSQEKPEEKGAGGGGGQREVKFDIDSVNISNAQIVYDDRQAARKLEADNLNLKTGRIASGVPSQLQLTANVKGSNPDINAAVAVKTDFTFNLEQKHYVVKGLDAEVKGNFAGFTDAVAKATGDADLRPDAKRVALNGINLAVNGKRAGQLADIKFGIPQLVVTDTKVSGGKLNGEARLAEGQRTITANFTTPSFEGTPQAFKLPELTLDAAVKQPGTDAKAKLSGALAGDIDKLLFTSPQLTLALSGTQEGKAINGSLTTPLNANLQTKVIDLPTIAANFTLPNPGGGTMALKAGGNANINLGKDTAAAALKGTLDTSNFDAKLGLAKFSPAAYTFDVGIDKIDLDRYKSKPAATAATTATPNAPPKKAGAEQPIDLSALRNLNANGSARIGALKVANISVSNLKFNMRAAGGKVDVNPLTASLYGGSVAGSLSLAATAPPHFAVRQNLSGVNIGPLLKDLTGKERLDGKGNVQLDVTASGATVSQIRKGLNGDVRMQLRDGSIRGVNIAQVIREAKAKIGEIQGNQTQAGTASADQKTDFTEMKGSFHIVNGVARNDDLDIKSPLIRVGGSGNIDIGNEQLNYLVKATVVSTLQGQGGPELQALKGLTVPVVLSGPFDAVKWRIDFAGLASELAKQKLGEKQEELKSKGQDLLQKQLKGLFGK